MYKRVPCRHFEPSSGRPIGSGCSKGGDCGFIHPDDSNWRDIRKEHGSRTPLAPQPYAFRRHQRELSRSPGHHRDGRHLARPKELRRPSIRGPQMNFHRGEASRSEYKRTEIIGRNVQQKGSTQERIKVEEIQEKPQMGKENVLDAEIVKRDRYMKRLDSNKESSGQVRNAFLQIARLTRESDILDEQQKKEGSKIVTYTAVEKTLNEISNQMGSAVIPQIDQSTMIQQDCRKKIAENNDTVNRLCKEVVELFVADINNAVDTHLQTALQNIRNEVVDLSKERQKRNFQSAEGETQAVGSSWSSDDFDGACRTKKRRTHTRSPYSPRRSTSKERPSMSSEIMKELEAKIERQAHALINLEKENEKLRAQNQILGTHTPAT